MLKEQIVEAIKIELERQAAESQPIFRSTPRRGSR
jgi:hypothetical protein